MAKELSEKKIIPHCSRCKEPAIELFEESNSAKFVCKSCYLNNMDNKRLSDDSKFKEHKVKGEYGRIKE
jgi:hypothetical protein